MQTEFENVVMTIKVFSVFVAITPSNSMASKCPLTFDSNFYLVKDDFHLYEMYFKRKYLRNSELVKLLLLIKEASSRVAVHCARVPITGN